MEVKHFSDPHGLLKISTVIPKEKIGDVDYNITEIKRLLACNELVGSDIVLFPELSLTGYTAADLFFQSLLIEKAFSGLMELTASLKEDPRVVVVGLPLKTEDKLFNCAAVLYDGEIAGFVPKTNIPNYQEFYEKRWFSGASQLRNKTIRIEGREVPIGNDLIFNCHGVKIGIEICEDLWVPIPPSSNLALNGATVILNLSATDENIGKYNYLKSLVLSQSARCRCIYAYASAGSGESSTDLVFSGNGIIAENGKLKVATPRFVRGSSHATAQVDIQALENDRIKYSSFHCDKGFTECRNIILSEKGTEDEISYAKAEVEMALNPLPFIPSSKEDLDTACNEIVNIQSWGLLQRLETIGCHKIVVGISGGLDSTLALLIAAATFDKAGWDKKNIIGVTMPSKATSSRTYRNAMTLMKCLGVSIMEIPIMSAVNQHFKDIGHDPDVHDAVYENSQARERTQILMDVANKEGAIVLGTGDLSELALGWCTYNGDHISMYNVNAGVPKTLVKHLVSRIAEDSDSQAVKDVLKDIVDTPISPELIPTTDDKEIGQITEDLVGPYELHDFFLYYCLRHGFTPAKIYRFARKAFGGKYSDTAIKKWLTTFYRRFFNQQFKRSCMPDGPKVGSICLSPRGDWRMPSDASAKLWIQQCDKLPE